jgi:hypothetical protein
VEQIIYGHGHHINTCLGVYQAQSIEEPSGTSYAILRSGELLCIISRNDKNEWYSNEEIQEEFLSEAVKKIKEIYLIV